MQNKIIGHPMSPRKNMDITLPEMRQRVELSFSLHSSDLLASVCPSYKIDIKPDGSVQSVLVAAKVFQTDCELGSSLPLKDYC